MASYQEDGEAQLVGYAWCVLVFVEQVEESTANDNLVLNSDGEARDSDEWELELLSEKWAYVTVSFLLHTCYFEYKLLILP